MKYTVKPSTSTPITPIAHFQKVSGLSQPKHVVALEQVCAGLRIVHCSVNEG